MERLQPLIGLVLIAAIAVAWSTNRRAIRLRTVAWGFGLQLLFAVIVLKTGVGQATFQVLGDRIRQLLEFSAAGSALVFGPLGDRAVWGDIMTRVLGERARSTASSSPSRSCRPSFSSPRCSRFSITSASCSSSCAALPSVMNRVMGASGAESLNVAASIFMGQTEAPLTIRPYLPRMTESELMTVMTAGHGAHLRAASWRPTLPSASSRGTCSPR